MLDFTVSTAQRQRKAKKLAELDDQPTLFASWAPNLDVHLHTPDLATVIVSGAEPERAVHWLGSLVHEVQAPKSKRLLIPTEKLDRLLAVRPPAHVTLDAASAAVAKALWAHKLGLKPLRVRRERQRLFAESPRWPSGMRIKDAPWTTIATLSHLGVPLDVDDDARALFARRLSDAGAKIATAGLAGSAVLIKTSRPEMIESMGLPGLAYAGDPGDGTYKLPLLSSAPLLQQPLIDIPADLVKAIHAATDPTGPLTAKKIGDGFPWTLFDFQANDAGRALRILETTGGVLLAGDMGSGKAVRADRGVITPTGTSRADAIRTGDYLIGRDGKPTQVLGVYPQGERQMYRVSFTDGTWVEVDDDHLWSVQSPVQKKRGRPGKVLSTRALREGLLRDGAGNLRWYIPIADPVQFEGGAPLPIHPYLLGVLLGDGGLSSGNVQITTDDPFIVEEVRALLPAGCTIRITPNSSAERARRAAERGCAPEDVRDQHYSVTGAPLRGALRTLDLLGKRSWEKAVPEAYLFATEHDRRAILQGLLDTDGSIHNQKQTSSVDFCSTSEQLVDDVMFLVQSLGGTARKSSPRRKFYTYKGERKQGRDAWYLSLQLPVGFKPFRLPRKADRYVDRIKYPPTRGIVSIEPTELADAVCFKVAAEDELFLLENMTVTHNTTVSLALAQTMDTWPLLVVAPLSAFSTWARQLGEMGRSYYMATESPAKSWEAIESGQHEAVVISFDRLPAFIELIERMHFKAMIADEIQRTRTPGSKRSRALRAIAASIPIRIGLSGTPVTNTLADILAVGAALAPGEWRPRANSKDLEDMYPGDPIEAIAEHLGSLMVRRRIDQVGKEMPTRNDHRVYVTMSPEQRQAIAALEAEAQAAKEGGEFDGPNGKFNALVKLGQMRKIIANPKSAGIGGPNPKIEQAVRIIKDFDKQGRKGVIFTVDRASFQDLGKELDEAGIRWGGIWGSTPPMERIEVEKRLHRGEIDVVICTVAAGAESWTASPTATYCLFLSYVWAPASLAQAEARVYRLNSDVNGPSIEILYLHATGVGGAKLGGPDAGEDAPQGSIDDRMVEVLEQKKALFAQVVDRTVHQDKTQVHTKLSDLLFVLTGQKDEALAKREADAQAVVDREKAKKKHAVDTLYAKKGRNKSKASVGKDDGSQTMTLEDYRKANDVDVDDLVEELDLAEEGDVEFETEGFDNNDFDEDDDE